MNVPIPDQIAPDWTLVDLIVGLPDYAVAFAVWPWPDGGWMAGVALTDKEWADEQGLLPDIRALTEQNDPPFSIFDGFEGGVNVHAPTAAEAVLKLWKELTT